MGRAWTLSVGTRSGLQRMHQTLSFNSSPKLILCLFWQFYSFIDFVLFLYLPSWSKSLRISGLITSKTLFVNKKQKLQKTYRFYNFKKICIYLFLSFSFFSSSSNFSFLSLFSSFRFFRVRATACAREKRVPNADTAPLRRHSPQRAKRALLTAASCESPRRGPIPHPGEPSHRTSLGVGSDGGWRH